MGHYTVEQITDYGKALEFYINADKYSVFPEVNITNVGNSKANDINVVIEFPDFISTMEKNKFDELESPNNILPPCPIKKAQKEYEEELSYDSRFCIPAINPSFTPNIISPFDKMIPVNINQRVKAKGHTVKIYLRSLMHTCNKEIRNKFAVIPLTAGKGHIQISVICEEYRKLSLFSFPIEVIEVDS